MYHVRPDLVLHTHMQLLLNADLFAPEPLGVAHLLIGGGKVLWQGTCSETPPSDWRVETIDLQGKRLMPGLIDGHAHLTGGGGESGFSSRVPPVPLSHFTSAGVTSVVGLLGTDAETRSMRSLVAQARGLREEGMSAWCYCGGYHLPAATVTGSIRSDIVHIDPIIGVGELAISDHRSSQPTLDEFLRVASEAHVAGMISGKAGIVHLHLGDGERGLDLVRRALDISELPARTFNPTHINRRRALFAEALEIAERGVPVDITAFPVEEGEDAWTAEDALERYLDAQLPAHGITVSSDGGGCLPHFDEDGRIDRFGIGRPQALADTLAALLSRGRALEQILPAFTTNVAQLLRLPHKGRIQVGDDADLITLDEQNRVADVMLGGVWHRRDLKQCKLGLFETEEK
ncbi:MAG: isoaspartyl dipeptidase [Lysobacteraceae bacterium]|nr:MAG: isoaspartyl dipeptidase [Xanthomonadaceae bacterium]